MSDDDEVTFFDRRIAVIGIISVYGIFLILSASEIIRFDEFIDLSENRRRIGKILMIPALYAIFLSVTGFAERLSDKYDTINYLVCLFISILASLLSTYIGELVIQPKYHPVYQDLYEISTFMMSLTVPYVAWILWRAFRKRTIGRPS